MSGFFGLGNAPQPPNILRSPVEQHSVLTQLLQQSIPLTLTFRGRNQRFLTYLAGTDLNSNMLALDALVPEEGQRLLLRGDPFRIDAYLDGVHICWTATSAPATGTLAGHTVAWFNLPKELLYHQKRSTFRARTLQDEPVSMTLAGNILPAPLDNIQVLDLSASGCKIRLNQPDPAPLEPGQTLHDSILVLPDGKLPLPVEIRHVQRGENEQRAILGLRFIHTGGMSQRTIERYVNHLQREARRRQEGELF